jgi:nucleoside phosphorylase
MEAESILEGHLLGQSIEEVLERHSRIRDKYSRPPAETDKLYKSDFVHKTSATSDKCKDNCSDAALKTREARDPKDDDPKANYGLKASANQLMKDANLRDQLIVEQGVLCFEMEAAGLMNHFPCIVIRGICGHSDSHKNDEWQGFAAMAAVAYAKNLLGYIPVSKIEKEDPLIKALHGSM